MGKVLDPIVVNPPKPNSTQPFNKEDIEKIAFNVLADLGDEVINKAIQEGKINIPENINFADLPQLDADYDTLTSEQVEQAKGKCWFSLSTGTTFYPCFSADDAVSWFGYDGYTFYFAIYHKVSDEWQFNDGESNYYDFADISGSTKLYQHEISFDSSSVTGTGIFQTPPIVIISTRAAIYNIVELDINVGVNAVCIRDDDGVIGSSMHYNTTNSELECRDALGNIRVISGITHFTDTVTEL